MLTCSTLALGAVSSVLVRQDRAVPLLPPEHDLALDPRLAPYRDRAALLYRAELQVGQLVVETDWSVEQTGGRFWWRQWSEQTEALRVHVLLGETVAVSLETPEVFNDLVARWGAGEFEVGGEVLRLGWLTDRESRLAEERVLWAGVSPADRMDRVRRLWRMHKAAPFPPQVQAAQVEGVDLVQLDADLAECIIEWIGSGGRLGAERQVVLAQLMAAADLVMPSLPPDERVRYRRLQRMAAPALAGTSGIS